MRNRRAIFVALIITLTSLSSAQATSINSVLQTDQYILFAHQDFTFRFLEANITFGYCPQVVTHPERDDLFYRLVGSHLIRDPNGKLSPKMLAIFDARDVWYCQIFPLNVFQEIQTPFLKSVDQTSERFKLDYRKKPTNGRVKTVKGMSITNTIFDTVTHMLYVDFSRPGNYFVFKYHLSEIFSDDPEYKDINKYTGRTSKHRYGFVEDPYSNKFYYKENIDNQTQYFEAAKSEIVDVISGKIDGNPVKMGSVNATLVGVSNGAFYGTGMTEDFDTPQNFTFISADKPEIQLNCEVAVNQSSLPKSSKIVIIRGNDYCMLRDGSNYNKEKCEEEGKHYVGQLEEEEFNFVLWLAILCFILLMVTILLCVYIYWLRASFIPDDGRHIPNEHETEASLFIAKQRSFPTSYQDPALLDISVDRWN